MSRTVRPSFRDSRFVLLVAGQIVNSVGGWFYAGPYAASDTIICWAARPVLFSPLLGVYIDRVGVRPCFKSWVRQPDFGL